MHRRPARAVAVPAKPISAPSQPITIASQMNVSLPVMMPSLRGSVLAVAIVSTVFVVSNEASFSPMISGIVASRASVSGGKSGPERLRKLERDQRQADAVGDRLVIAVDHLGRHRIAEERRKRRKYGEAFGAGALQLVAPAHRVGASSRRSGPKAAAARRRSTSRHTRRTSSCSSRVERRSFARVHVHRDRRRLLRRRSSAMYERSDVQSIE